MASTQSDFGFAVSSCPKLRTCSSALTVILGLQVSLAKKLRMSSSVDSDLGFSVSLAQKLRMLSFCVDSNSGFAVSFAQS